MLIRILISIILINVSINDALTAQLPTTNIYSLNLTKVGANYKFSSPRFLTAFNKQGYNNQPSFFEDKVIYFTTDYYDSEQTEISKFDLFENTLTRITYTPEKEYSPTPVPKQDAFSVIRVESDNKTQTLSLYPLDGIGFGKRYMNNTSNIGYHNWIDEHNVALFLVVLDNIGRCLKINKRKDIVFIHKQSPIEWWIKSYNTKTNKSTTIIKTLIGSEDFEILNDGSFIMGNKSKLYHFQPNKSKEWVELIDLKDQGITNIKRLTVRKNLIVLVNEAS